MPGAGCSEHHEVGAVDLPEAVDMVRLGAVEQRPQHRFLVDGIGKHARVGRSRIAHPRNPASITPRTMNRCSTRNTTSVGRVASAAPVMIISHLVSCASENDEMPTGIVYRSLLVVTISGQKNAVQLPGR